jgi:hypothetical protein
VGKRSIFEFRFDISAPIEHAHNQNALPLYPIKQDIIFDNDTSQVLRKDRAIASNEGETSQTLNSRVEKLGQCHCGGAISFG